MKTANNPSKHPLTLRDLEKMTGYTYEHCRKAVTGRPVVSAEFNDRLCKVLGLDGAMMWQLAEREKKARAIKRLGVNPVAESDARLAAVWQRLSETQRDAILALADDFSRSRTTGAEMLDSPASCYLLTLKGHKLVVARSSSEARARAVSQSPGIRVVETVKIATLTVVN
jgi:hypothetical protein